MRTLDLRDLQHVLYMVRMSRALGRRYRGGALFGDPNDIYRRRFA